MRISLLAATYTMLFSMLAIAVPPSASASAAGKFDGEWVGKLSCSKFAYHYGDGGSEFGEPIEGTEVISDIRISIGNDKILRQSGFTSTGNKDFSANIDSSDDSIKIQATHPKFGLFSIDGEFINNGGDRFIKFEGNTADDRICEFIIARSGSGLGSGQLATLLRPIVGKFDGEWKGKIICGEATENLTEATTPPVDNGTGLTVKIGDNGRVSKFMWDGGEDQKIVIDGTITNSGKFSLAIKYVTEDGYDDTMTVAGEYKNQPLILKWNWLSIESARPSNFPAMHP